MMVLGVIGDKRVAKSLSPRMHNAVLRSRGMDGWYVPLEVAAEGVGRAVAGLAALGFAGANVTVPHKQAVIPHLVGLSPEAEKLGAVNTIVCGKNGPKGFNTDLPGFLAALDQAGVRPAGLKALVMGCGGAARAVTAALQQAGAGGVHVAARDAARAGGLTNELGGRPVDLGRARELAAEAHIIVNATSVSAPGEGPALAELVSAMSLGPDCRLVMDLNYGRKENIWAKLAHRQGAAFCDGLAMLAHQACLSFALWTGIKPDAREFSRALEDAP